MRHTEIVDTTLEKLTLWVYRNSLRKWSGKNSGKENTQKKWEVLLKISNSGIGKYVPKLRGREARKKFWFNKRCEAMKKDGHTCIKMREKGNKRSSPLKKVQKS